MDGDKRREQIIKILSDNTLPVAGTELAGRLGVSRQVIVQDIALLRAVNKNILSTNKGYLLFHEEKNKKAYKRTYKVMHSNDRIREELYCIVDCGGRLLDVVVEHPIYGQIIVDLIINSRLYKRIIIIYNYWENSLWKISVFCTPADTVRKNVPFTG